MSAPRRVTTAIVAALLAIVGAIAVSPAASAISRVSCSNNSYLWIFSNQTTCWANAGTANVNLYSTHGYSSGNNAGRVVRNAAGSYYFSKYTSDNWTIDRVIQITIY